MKTWVIDVPGALALLLLLPLMMSRPRVPRVVSSGALVAEAAASAAVGARAEAGAEAAPATRTVRTTEPTSACTHHRTRTTSPQTI